MPRSPVFEVLEPRLLLSASPAAAADNLFARAITSDAIELTWDDACLSESGFTLQRSLDGGVYHTIASLPADTTEYVDDSLAADTLHFYRVRAELPDRPSVWSNRNYAMTLSPLSSAYGVSGVRASWAPDATVTVTWAEGFDGETAYEVQRRNVTAGGSFQTVATTLADADTFVDTGRLEENTRYAYRVRAVSDADQTQWSPETSACVYSYGSYFSLTEIDSSLAAATDLQAVSDVTSQITLTWVDNAIAESNYALSVSFDGVHYEYLANLAADSTGYIHTGVTNLGKYHYRLLASGSGGAASLPVEVTGQARPFDDSLAIPVGLTATWDAETGVRLDWSPVGGALGYAIETRSEQSVQRLATVPADQPWFVDPSGSKFTNYRVQVLGTDGDSRYTEMIDAHNYVPEPTTAVTNLRTTRRTTTRIDLAWDDIEQSYKGFRVLRSIDGGEFHTVAWLEDERTVFEDHSLSAGMSVAYRVVTEGESPEPFAEIVTSTQVNLAVPAAPGSLVATGVGRGQVNLSWTDHSDNETHYLLQRRPGSGGDFVTVATLPAGATRYSDAGLDATTDYLYRLQAVGSAGASSAAEVAATTLGSDPSVSVSTKALTAFDRLRIDGTAANDHIVLTQSGDTIHVHLNGSLLGGYSGPFGEIMLYGGDGDDMLEADATVTARLLMYGQGGNDTLTFAGSGKAFLVSLGGGRDVLTGNGMNTSYWTDWSEDVVNASPAELDARRVHRIENFYQPGTFDPTSSKYYDKELDGQAWVDPGIWGTREGSQPDPNTYPGHSVWGLSPSILDVNQGSAQTCPFTGRYQIIAAQQPEAMEEYAVDLGDGTYAVDIQGDLVARIDGSFWSYYSDIGPSGNIWWLLVEKTAIAYTLPLEDPAFLDSERFNPMSMTSEDVERVQRELRFGSAVCAWNIGNRVLGAPVVRQEHNYGVLDIYDRDGQTWVILRNPYGGREVGFEDGLPAGQRGLLTLTMEQFQANFSSLYLEPARTSLAARHVFYNNSAQDGGTPGSHSQDDGAIANNKQALLPGETASFANYTSYSRGINGIMIDIDGLVDRASASDFVFTVGNSDDPSTWTAVPEPAAVDVREHPTEAGQHRITLTWADGAIANQWLEVKAKSDANGGSLGLAEDDVFYFGNLAGDTDGDADVDFRDAWTLMGSYKDGASDHTPADGDFTADGVVDEADAAALQANYGQTLTMFTAPEPAPTAIEPVGAIALSSPTQSSADEPEENTAGPTETEEPAGEQAPLAFEVSGLGTDQVDLLADIEPVGTYFGDGSVPTKDANATESKVLVDGRGDTGLEDGPTGEYAHDSTALMPADGLPIEDGETVDALNLPSLSSEMEDVLAT